ncbi:MAG: aldehyde dehydrogenase family protein, partial [Sporichthyaceae bacterium]|nr:aldehyde dehydrogenase family protein [Sporichthyaceae bacterium]
MTDVRPFWLAGRPETGDDVLEVTHPYDGRVVAQVAVPTDKQVEQAVAAADEVRAAAAALPIATRAEALAHTSRRLAERAEEIAALITAENGKPIRWARLETARAVSTFRWAAEEARRWSGQVQR